MRELDVVVIGAGPAGEVAAGRLADAGLEVALAERELVGGECSFWACMPSKALLRPGELVREVARVPGTGLRGTGPDPAAVLARRDEVVHGFDDAVQLPWLEDRGIVLLRGQARITGERTVRVGDEELRARRAVVLATGSESVLPPVDGLADARPWTSREATAARAVPARLLVLGGGVVGVELAQAYADLGAGVTLLEPGPRLLAREEEFASAEVAEGLAARGVDVRCATEAAHVARRPDGGVVLRTASGDEVEADELLVAAGRRPRTSGVGLEELGLPADAPPPTDDALRVDGHPWLFAVGDVNGRAPLTHVGKYQARVAADVILGRDVRVRDVTDPPPRVVFCEPQVAAVGHTAASARDAGLQVRVADVATSANAGASFKGKDAPGTCRLVAAGDVLVGATFTGPDVQELLHAATIAVTARTPLRDLWHAVPAFPTRNEVWLRLLEELGAQG